VVGLFDLGGCECCIAELSVSCLLIALFVYRDVSARYHGTHGGSCHYIPLSRPLLEAFSLRFASYTATVTRRRGNGVDISGRTCNFFGTLALVWAGLLIVTRKSPLNFAHRRTWNSFDAENAGTRFLARGNFGEYLSGIALRG